MSANPTVDILLATYNGERYLAEQIDSLFAQTFDDWRLIARDDGSADRTVAIVKDYAKRHPGRVVLIEDDDCGLGACGNFGRLMEYATADYVMFCDQDDVWLPDKIETLIAAMHELEAGCERDAPLLVHSDLRVVGPDLEDLHVSFWEYQIIDPLLARSLNRLLIQNVVTGCTALFNRRLVELARPLPAEAVMHDWWIALIAGSLGRVVSLPQQTVLYRQHGTNTLGARRGGWIRSFRRASVAPLRAISRTRNVIRATQRQSAALLVRHGEEMDWQKREFVSRYACLREEGFVARRVSLLKHRFAGTGVLHNLIVLLCI